jgi:predicted MFS family arabinose efflux permease
MISEKQPAQQAIAKALDPLAVALCGLAALAVAMGIGRFAFTPILPVMQADLGITVREGGWLASANYAGYLIGAVLAIRLRARSATIIVAGVVAIGVVTLAMGLTQRFGVWIILRAAAGIASAFVLVHVSAWSLQRLTEQDRADLNGFVFAGVGAGIAIAGLMCLGMVRAGAVSAHHWLALGLIAIAVSAWLGCQLRAEQHPFPETSAHTPGENGQWGLDEATLIICYGAFGFGYIIPATFLPVLGRQAIADPAVFSWAWPTFGAAAAVSTLMAATVSRRLRSRLIWAVSQLLMAAGVLATATIPGTGGIAFASLAVGGTFMVITMAGMQEARTVAGGRARRLIGAMTAAFAIGQIAGPLFIGLMAGHQLGFRAPLFVTTFILVVSAIVLLASHPAGRRFFRPARGSNR